LKSYDHIKKPQVDAVLIGFGWTGAIMAWNSPKQV